MNAITPIEMEGIVERFDDLGDLDEGWEAMSKADLRQEVETRMSVVRVRRVLWITVTILFLLNSAGLVQLVQGLSIGPVQDTVIVMAETWNGEMERHGVTQIREEIRLEVTRILNLPWPDPGRDPGGDLGGEVAAEARSGLPDLRLGEAMPELSGASIEEDRAAVLRGMVLDNSGS